MEVQRIKVTALEFCDHVLFVGLGIGSVLRMVFNRKQRTAPEGINRSSLSVRSATSLEDYLPDCMGGQG